MSSDHTTNPIQRLIDECREQWAEVGEGELDLMWVPVHEGEDLADFISPDGIYTGNRESVTSLCLTADNGNPCNGVVSLPRMPESFRYFETKYERLHEIDFFDYISRRAGALLISYCLDTLQPYLSSEGANQGDPRAWWIAYLWSQFGEVPETKDDQNVLLLNNILFLTIRALEQLKQFADDGVTPPVGPSTEPKQINTDEIQIREDSDPSLEFWDQGSPQQRKIVRFVLDNGGRTTRKKLEDSDGIFKEPPPTDETLQRALNRVNDALLAYAYGWSLKWTSDLANTAAEVWLEPPDTSKTESGLNPD